MSTLKVSSMAVLLGAACLLASCSDPAPPAARAATTVTLTQPSRSGSRCPDIHTINLPYRTSAVDGVTATQVAERLVDGENKARVSCTVRQSGSDFYIEASLTASDASGGLLSFTANVGANRDDGTMTIDWLGDNRVLHLATLPSIAESTCKISVKPAPGEMLAVAPGKLWARFTCDNLADPGAPVSACGLDPSYVVLENCDR